MKTFLPVGTNASFQAAEKCFWLSARGSSHIISGAQSPAATCCSEKKAAKFPLRASDDLTESTDIDYLGNLSIIPLGVNGKERERERERESVFLHVQVLVTSLSPSLSSLSVCLSVHPECIKVHRDAN